MSLNLLNRIIIVTFILFSNEFIVFGDLNEKTLVAAIGKRIKTSDSIVVVDKVVINPNNASIYGKSTNRGIPVEEEYGKGPLVIICVEKKPGTASNASFPEEWINVELFSDGLKLSRKSSSSINSGKIIFGFSHWVDTTAHPDKGKLKNLGKLDLKVVLNKISYVFDIPLKNISETNKPLFEDRDIKVQEIKWETEIVSEKTYLWLRFKRKNPSAVYNLALGNKSDPTYGLGDIQSWVKYLVEVHENKNEGVYLWKRVPLAEKTFTDLKFSEQ